MNNLTDALDLTFAGNTLRTYLVVVLVLALGVLLGRLVRYALTRILPKLTSRTSMTLDDRLIERTAQPLSVLVWFAAAHVSVQILDLPDRAHTFLVSALVIAVAVTLAVTLLRAIDVLFEELMEPWAARQSPAISVQVVHVTRIAVKVVAVSLLTVTVLQRAGFDVLSVVTGLGIGGLAVALAAQETLGNVLGSLQILTDRPFQVGDWVKADGHFGRVTHIGMRSTRLTMGNGIRIVIPNKKIAEAAVENHSTPSGLLRDFTLGLTYDTPPDRIERAVAVVQEILAEQAGVHAERSVQFSGFGDSQLNLRIIYYVPDWSQAGGIHHAVNLAIRTRFEAEGLQFAFPTRTVHVVGLPAPVDSGP